MHTTLSSQLKTLKLTDAVRESVSPLPSLLEAITKVGEEEEGDPLTSTIEALRVMQTTISQFSTSATIGATSGDNSGSSSEYTTPAQSQATSPSHEQSPPPPGLSIQSARATVNTAARLMATAGGSGGGGGGGNGGGGGESSQQYLYHHQGSVSPSTSPTHGEKVSSLATHSHTAHIIKAHTMQERGVAGMPEGANTSRRKSDSEIQKHRVRPASQQLPASMPDQSSQIHYRSIDCSINDYDAMDITRLKLENARLLHDNTQLQHDVKLLQKKLEQFNKDNSKENDKLRKMEEAKRQSDYDLQHVKESRGKVFRGLNMQTEIAKVQFKRDFENMKKQLQNKEEIIVLQERKIASLVEETCTLRLGLQALHSLPKHDSSDSDLDEEEEGIEKDSGSSKRSSLHHSSSGSGIMNGHTHAIHSNATVSGPLPNYASRDNPAGVNPDLLQVISQLDSGKFVN